MRTSDRISTLFIFVIIVVFVLTGLSCVSRYRLDLSMYIDKIQRKAKVEKSEVIFNARLDDPYAEKKISDGSGAILILTTAASGRRTESSTTKMFGFDEYLQSRLYLETVRPLMPSKSELKGSSIVHLLGRYDLTPEEKIFLPESGFWQIDSVTNSHLFGNITGSYKNSSGAVLGYDGRFKIKVK